jgi:hypothetical protein
MAYRSRCGWCRARLKEKNYVWKRTRHSLRKKRDEEKFRAAQVEIAELVEKSTLGEINLAYVDEAGVAQTPPNRSAWTEKGEVHLTTAERGKRLNVLAALISTGTLFSAMFWETTTAAAFAGFLGLLLKHVGGPLTVILDNASIHKAKAIQPDAGSSEAAGPHALLPASLQPGTEPHRAAMAQNEV